VDYFISSIVLSSTLTKPVGNSNLLSGMNEIRKALPEHQMALKSCKTMADAVSKKKPPSLIDSGQTRHPHLGKMQ
jgi:hypothetical protein